MVWIAFIIVAVVYVALKAISFTGKAPLRSPQLSELPGCPESPNCVCSQDSTDDRAVDPLGISTNPKADWERLVGAIQDLGGRLVEERRLDYARFEFRSRFIRFVDDVEILMNEAERRIEIRSASRSGYSDFGVNRRRVEAIRARYDAS